MTMTLEQKVARLRLVADGLRRIQEFESARYLDEYATHLTQPAQSVDVEKVREVIEEIAEQWHGCMYDAPGETVDISDAIRRAGTRLITAALQEKGNG